MKQHKRGKIYYSMQAMSILPLLLFGILIIFFSTYTFSNTLTKEVATGLEDAAHLCTSLFDAAYPGDYQLIETKSGSHTAYSLYKGNTDITTNHHILDQIKDSTSMDVTLFYQDTRVLTTITNWSKQRIIGTSAPDIVVNDVLKQNTAKFYDNVIINGQNYFAYYTPLTNSDGSVIGMLFIGKPAETVLKMVNTSIYPIIWVGIIALILAAIISFTYAKNFVSALQKLKIFFSKVSTGNLNAELDKSVLRREDELSQIGRAALSMQSSLRNLIEQDTLTELYNRRSGNKKLQSTYEKSKQTNTPFCLVIADIDHFKSINDTYGHHNGDIVLRNVAGLLKKHTQGKGYAIRWGGEEFLLVFENCPLENAIEHLQNLQTELANTTHTLDESETHVTMTFGISCDANMDVIQLLQTADEKLYKGKNNGRNCIIS
ncbi:MAG: diguanylate cyclase [Lachnospiraceae bacterium]|nr:diguanylate cyclase [Lachnospiraceae bacterium]